VLVVRNYVNETGSVKAEMHFVHRNGASLAHFICRTRCDFCSARNQACFCPDALWQRSMLLGRHTFNSWMDWMRRAREHEAWERVEDRQEGPMISGITIHSNQYFFGKNPVVSQAHDAFIRMLGMNRPQADNFLNIKDASRTWLLSFKSSVNVDTSLTDSCITSLITCSMCGTSFANQSNLSRHIQTMHGEGLTFVCQLCGKVFHQRSNLLRHEMMVHLGLKPFECLECGKRFGSKPNLKRHQKKLHPFLDG